MEYKVRDGQRELTFNGELLAESSSQSVGRTRWVEFELYRTAGGAYVLSRIGRSVYYHDASCSVVARNRIQPVPFGDVEPGYLACESCRPDDPRYGGRGRMLTDETLVHPERPRYWAQVSETAEGVISSLYKFDDTGTKYMTNVAKRLLADAAARDDSIRDEFFNERIA